MASSSSMVLRGSPSAPTRCGGRANQVFSRTCPAPARAIGARRARAVRVRVAKAEEVISEQDQTKLDELVNRWRMFDINGDGSIDREELRQLLESTESGTAVLFTQHWLPEDELDRIMEKYDRNNNGRIDFDEFQQIVYDGLMLEGALAEYEAAFKAVDSSGNGTIGATELAEVLRSTGNNISYENMVDIMQQYDKDESGQIEFEEFLLMFRDKLLDLQAVKAYMGARPEDGKAPSEALLDAPEGDIALIFSEQELDEVIAQSKAQGKVLVVFCALTWCRPCKAVQRPSQKMAATYKDCTTWVKIFGNANEQTKSIFKKRFKIRSTPAFIMVKDGEVVLAQTGSNKEKLEAALRAALGAHPALPKGMLYPSAEALMAAAVVDAVATATAPVPEPAIAPTA